MPNIQKIVVSGSNISQLNNDAGYVASVGAGIVSSSTQIIAGLATTGIVSSSAQIDALFNIDGLISSSAQIAELGAGIVSSSTQLEGAFDTRYLNTTGDSVVSSSAQINVTNNIVDAAAAIEYTKLDFEGSGFLSSSGQLGVSDAQIALEGSNGVTINGGASGTFTLNQLATASFDIAIPSGVVSASSFSSPSQGTVRAVINGVQTDVDTGLQTGDSPQFTNLTLTGDLFVGGATTTINTANLNIEDKFILLNSGSSGATAEGGIIVEASGSGVGNAFYYDSLENRWSVAEGVNYDDTAVTAEAFMSVAIVDTLANAESSSYYQTGNIIIDGQDIYIVTV
jgi:hypothetical protein